MKAGRNPRRSYDGQGNEVAPPTVADALSQDFKTVQAWCLAEDCDHGAVVPLDGFEPSLPVPDIALHLRCSQCGSRSIKIQVNVTELYDRCWGGKNYGKT